MYLSKNVLLFLINHAYYKKAEIMKSKPYFLNLYDY